MLLDRFITTNTRGQPQVIHQGRPVSGRSKIKSSPGLALCRGYDSVHTHYGLVQGCNSVCILRDRLHTESAGKIIRTKFFFSSPFQGISLLSSRSNPHTRIKDIITLYYLLGGQAPTRCWCYVMLCECLKSQEPLTKNNHRRLTMWSLPETDKLTLIRLASLQQEAFQICQRFQSAFSLSGVTQAGSASPRRRGKHRKWQQRPAAANKVSGNAAQAAVSPELNFLY